ncbi:ABC transporter permease [Galbitalea soli]|uniref:ABC transporter permease n=2 Tax=Galbitalea soli TaxID=1268042 RepID=A0A7C9PM09_9MICO|nr:ABC transporter permease [Galbitalea soli]NEM90431.1 ABC transporter permease [Galbitalea soli]NYJ31142.1 spermidine/putrescine transport system permease protein [Galbitalea soli]
MAMTAFAGAPTQAEPAPRRQSKIALVLLLPGILYLVLFFIVPLVSLVITSLEAPAPDGSGTFQYAFNWQNYVDSVGTYSTQIFRSFLYALLATVFALLFSYPLAYFIGVKVRKWPLLQSFMLILVIAPFFISFLLRTLAWKTILADEGPIVTSLKALSLLGPQTHITGTPVAVVFGLTYNFIPFMCLPLYTTLERLDIRYLEASSDLYGTPASTFWRVTIPLSLPGIVSGTLLTFIPAAGDYVNASQEFLGGASSSMIGNVIQSNFLVQLNYPAAAALSIVLMLVILIIVGSYVRRAGTDDLL